MDNPLIAVLALCSIALIEFGIVYGNMSYLDVLPKYSVRRLLGWVAMIMAIVGGTPAQIFVYRSITGKSRVADDLVLISMICLTNILSVVAIFYTRWHRRS